MILKKTLTYLILPPFFSFIISGIKAYQSQKVGDIYAFLFCYTLFIVFVYPEYDTFLSFFDALSSNGISSNDSLTNLIAYICLKTSLNFYHLFPLIWLTTILLFFKSVTNAYNTQKKIPAITLLLFLFSLILRNWVGLTYFTLASSIAIYYGTKKGFLAFLFFSTIIFFVHPGVLIIFIPSYIYHTLSRKNKKTLSTLFLIFYAIVTFILFNGNSIILASDVNNAILHNLLSRFSHYTDSDYIWGGKGLEMSFLGYLNRFLMYCMIFFTTILAIKKHIYIRNDFWTSMLIIGSIALFNSISLWTLSERFTVISLMNTTLVLTKLTKEGHLSIKQKKIFLSVSIITFLLPIWFHRKTREHIFRDISTSYDISLRTAYIPSALLIIDIEDFGFSDNYIIKNVKFGREIWEFSNR